MCNAGLETKNTTTQEIDEMLKSICFADLPYETRAEMCEALVRAVKEERSEGVRIE